MSDNQDLEAKQKGGKKQCDHTWARIWLASKNYQESKFCTKCLELKNAKKPGQECR